MDEDFNARWDAWKAAEVTARRSPSRQVLNAWIAEGNRLHTIQQRHREEEEARRERENKLRAIKAAEAAVRIDPEKYEAELRERRKYNSGPRGITQDRELTYPLNYREGL